MQTDHGVKFIKEWALSTNQLSEDDLFISADVDEVLSRETLQKLQWCQLNKAVISGAIWMPMGDLENAYKSTFAANGFPHMFGMPTIYRWGDLLHHSFSGRRLFERPSNFVLGGIHMTNPAFLPTALLKELTATENGYYNGFINLPFLFNMTLQEMEEEQKRIYRHHYRQCWKADIDLLRESHDAKAYIPWFLSCNTSRFPYWYGKPDPRYENLLEMLHNERSKFNLEGDTQHYRRLFNRYFFPNYKNRAACNILEVSFED